MKKFKIVLITISSFIVSYGILLALTSILNSSTGLNESADVYVFRSYITSLIIAVLILISTIITCTYVLVNNIKNKK